MWMSPPYERGTNAIMSAFGLIQAIEAFTRDLNERVKTHPWFSRLEAPIKFNPGKIRGGDWASSTPAWCEVDCRIAVYPGTPLKTFRAELADVVSRAAQRDPFLSTRPRSSSGTDFRPTSTSSSRGLSLRTPSGRRIGRWQGRTRKSASCPP
jgi:acetylornithine deacetylase/succinyl-diaminopimelate desuccinylase-like protein